MEAPFHSYWDVFLATVLLVVLLSASFRLPIVVAIHLSLPGDYESTASPWLAVCSIAEHDFVDLDRCLVQGRLISLHHFAPKSQHLLGDATYPFAQTWYQESVCGSFLLTPIPTSLSCSKRQLRVFQ